MLKLYVVLALLCRDATRKEGDIEYEAIYGRIPGPCL